MKKKFHSLKASLIRCRQMASPPSSAVLKPDDLGQLREPITVACSVTDPKLPGWMRRGLHYTCAITASLEATRQLRYCDYIRWFTPFACRTLYLLNAHQTNGETQERAARLLLFPSELIACNFSSLEYKGFSLIKCIDRHANRSLELIGITVAYMGFHGLTL